MEFDGLIARGRAGREPGSFGLDDLTVVAEGPEDGKPAEVRRTSLGS